VGKCGIEAQLAPGTAKHPAIGWVLTTRPGRIDSRRLSGAQIERFAHTIEIDQQPAQDLTGCTLDVQDTQKDVIGLDILALSP
jgi:hypothetical protein